MLLCSKVTAQEIAIFLVMFGSDTSFNTSVVIVGAEGIHCIACGFYLAFHHTFWGFYYVGGNYR